MSESHSGMTVWAGAKFVAVVQEEWQWQNKDKEILLLQSASPCAHHPSPNPIMKNYKLSAFFILKHIHNRNWTSSLWINESMSNINLHCGLCTIHQPPATSSYYPPSTIGTAQWQWHSIIAKAQYIANHVCHFHCVLCQSNCHCAPLPLCLCHCCYCVPLQLCAIAILG